MIQAAFSGKRFHQIKDDVRLMFADPGDIGLQIHSEGKLFRPVAQ